MITVSFPPLDDGAAVVLTLAPPPPPPTTALRPSIVCCTSRSLTVSSDDVASSSSRILGFRTRARAIAILCFCPPESWDPPDPGRVSNLSGSDSISSQICACLHAAITSASEGIFSDARLSQPYSRFSRIVHSNSTGSCCTYPICRRSSSKLGYSVTGRPLTHI
mmetsp:Transcript_3764/g.9126  ORF Transcript_3764/g.9126 Transcript_3764/m.9126 type:complete len:164 (-) Transcript_3764:1900-2391(-)